MDNADSTYLREAMEDLQIVRAKFLDVLNALDRYGDFCISLRATYVYNTIVELCSEVKKRSD